MSQGFPTGVWVAGLTISGNVLQCQSDFSNNNAPVCIAVNGLQWAVITGNTFASDGGSAATGVALGPQTAGVNVQSNVYAGGVVTTVVNGGTLSPPNTVGGGSA